MSAHTPGPWVVTSAEQPDDLVTSTHAQGLDDDVCEVYGGNDDLDEVRAANARLIASAPDLLEALKALSGAVGFRIDDPRVQHIHDAARAAIARAEGKSL